MCDYTSYRKVDIESGIAMHPVDAVRFAKSLPHAIHRMPDWEFFLSYMNTSKVAFVKPITEPDATGQVTCEVIAIPFI